MSQNYAANALTSFSPLRLREKSGWPDVSLNAKTNGNGSTRGATVLSPSQRWFYFPSQPTGIFNFWITLVFKKIVDRLTPENEDVTHY